MRNLYAAAIIWLPLFFVMCGERPGSATEEEKPISGGNSKRLTVDITYRLNNNEVISDIIADGVVCGNDAKLFALLKKKAEEAGFDEKMSSKPDADNGLHIPMLEGERGVADSKRVSRLSVVIRADERVAYQSVQRIMVLCMKAGISDIRLDALANKGKGGEGKQQATPGLPPTPPPKDF